MKTVLFVIHESKKSGAPLLILQLLKELKASYAFNIHILVTKTGELDKALQEIGPTYFFNPTYLLKLDLKSKISRKVRNPKKAVAKHRKVLYAELEHNQYDIIYFNSLGCNPMFSFFDSYKAKKITHIHELQTVVSGMNQEAVKSMLSRSQVLVSSCKTITDFLIETYNIDTTKLVENSVFLFPERKRAIDKLKLESKPEGDPFRIGACGGVELRKGTDIFVDFAIKTIQEIPNVAFEFVWVGNDKTDLARKLKQKINDSGFQDKIRFTGSTARPETYFKSFDLFFLASREEAFGLVGLENAYCEVPLVSFDIAGDLPLFIQKYNCGKVIPQFEYSAFKHVVTSLIENPTYAKALGQAGKQAVVTDFNIKDQATVIKTVLNT
ncbi:glycosyltransferase family 4 protein [Mangrovimonas sp. TPBH4]|uniref:glycosyltransferase family 4 protein n=1 Tax=Mangrovimonas sp. TPBH4 TaxID=1645914 RepID=UPI0006B4CB99|nr:glycosyltransferase family 4 protein [Mangrovimonas sp. TPBH4]